MERRFKLIKQYPFCGCDEGDIETVHSESKEFEKYPEFWQEIFPVAFKSSNGIYRKRPDGHFTTKREGFYDSIHSSSLKTRAEIIQELYWHESDIPGEREWEVVDVLDIGDGPYSVKWLPTGEVFKVGDWFERKIRDEWEGERNQIKSFEANGEDCNILDEVSCRYPFSANTFRRIDPPILTTEDGKPFFKGDECFTLPKENLSEKYIGTWKLDENPPNWLCFSTRKAAQSYIDEHSKKYSLEDVKRAYRHMQSSGVTWDLMDLIEKLKEGVE